MSASPSTAAAAAVTAVSATPPASEPRPVIHLICQAHLDPVWLWTWRDGFAEMLTTWQSAVDRMREFPAMRYSASTAALYRWVQETDPRLFGEIRDLIAAGRWEVVGGTVVEPDLNLGTDLSLHRQGTIGQAWFRATFGVAARVGYCVDSFGHPAGLPSVLAAAGMRHYVFQRPRPEERPDLPNLFWWEAPDGERVLAWRLARGYGQGPTTSADELETLLRRDWRRGLVPGLSVGTAFIGIGNHGGGPTRAHIERLVAMQASDDPTLPDLRFSTLGEFFADVEAQPGFADAVPVIRGELLHHARGCYSANTRFKRRHRQAERELVVAERLVALRDGQPGDVALDSLPPPDFAEAWWTLAFNQFHDILPGSSVPVAYEQADDDLGAVRHFARRRAGQAVHALARRADTRGAPEGTLFVANALPFARFAVVTVDTFVSPHGDSRITHLRTPDGTSWPLQWTAADAGFGPYLKEWKKLVALIPLAAHGTRWYHLAHGSAPSALPDDLAAPHHADRIQALRPVADALRFAVVEDRADTWGHDVASWPNVLGQAELSRELDLDDGPLFRRRRRWYTWRTSSVVLDVIEWLPLGIVELVLQIHWHEAFQTLKLEIPISPAPAAASVVAGSAGAPTTLRARTPGGAVDRPLDGNEFPFIDWLAVDSAVGQAAGRLAVVSDGVSAYDATAERLRLTLLRSVPYAQHDPVPHSPDSPQPFLDNGHQQARFWLVAPGPDDSSDLSLDRIALEVLTPADHMLDSAHAPSSTR